MRAIGAVVLVIMIIFVGVIAVSYAGQNAQDSAITNGTNQSADAYNATEEVTNQLAQGLVPLIVYGGIGVLLIIALGVLVSAGMSGR